MTPIRLVQALRYLMRGTLESLQSLLDDLRPPKPPAMAVVPVRIRR